MVATSLRLHCRRRCSGRDDNIQADFNVAMFDLSVQPSNCAMHSCLLVCSQHKTTFPTPELQSKHMVASVKDRHDQGTTLQYLSNFPRLAQEINILSFRLRVASKIMWMQTLLQQPLQTPECLLDEVERYPQPLREQPSPRPYRMYCKLGQSDFKL
jgi:hypothetical protein